MLLLHDLKFGATHQNKVFRVAEAQTNLQKDGDGFALAIYDENLA